MSGHAAPGPSILDRRFPPVVPVLSAALGLAIVGGILMATQFPRRPDLLVPTVLLAAAVLGLVVATVMTVRIRSFARDRFRVVFGWALLAYVVQAGMIGYAFVHNHASGAPLAVIIGLLAVFALSVPFLIAFTAARYASPAVA